MAFTEYKYGVGLRNVGSYQISGHPYVTGSTLGTGQEKRVSFPYVTKEFTVINSGSTGTGPKLRVHFVSTGSDANVIPGHHYVTLENDDQSITFNVKCKEIYITCTAGGTNDNGFEVVASLTNIMPNHMYPLTGSGITLDAVP